MVAVKEIYDENKLSCAYPLDFLQEANVTSRNDPAMFQNPEIFTGENADSNYCYVFNVTKQVSYLYNKIMLMGLSIRP